MSVRIGQASKDENSKLSGGKAGNQTRTKGKLDGELNIRDWYNKPWTYVFRCKDSEKAEKIAQTMYECVSNSKIGYDQNERTTLYNQMKSNGWKASKVGYCECDCSALTAVCVNAAGIKVSGDMYTGDEYDVLKATNMFQIFKDDAHCHSSKLLKRGDIIFKPFSHSAVVLDDGEDEEEEFDEKYVTTARVNMRSGPGTSYDRITTVPANKTIMVSKITGNWAHCIYDTYTGYVSKSYIKKKSVDPEPTENTYYITTAKIWLRKDAGTSYTKLTSIQKGTRLLNDGTSKTVDGVTWYKVSYNGKTGYSSGEYMEKSVFDKKYTATSSVYMRSGAGKSYNELCTVKCGETVLTDGSYKTSNSVKWLYCYYNDLYGYISSKYLSGT